MKKTLLTVVISLCFFLIHVPAKSQDLIIMPNGDSIRCEIINAKNNFIVYKHVVNNQIVKHVVAKASVSSYKENYFYTKPVSIKPPYKPFRFSLNGGISHMTQKEEEDWDELEVQYNKVLKRGFHLEFEGSYFITRNFGLGLAIH